MINRLRYEQHFIVNKIGFGRFLGNEINVILKRLEMWLLENYDYCSTY